MSTAAISSTRVLVLNRSFVPIHVTSVKRAFCLIYMGVAKVVDEQYQTFDFQSWLDLTANAGEETMGLIGKAIRVPRVILLHMYDKLPKKHIRFSRLNIFARDKNMCQYCGDRFAKVDLNLDHIIPRSRGGTTTWENIVCSCIPCNRKKGARSLSETGMRLMKVPKKPSWVEGLSLSMKNKFYKEWKPFLNVIDFSYWNVELDES